jgi:peptidoglycan/xylan/chitin deacetylase (PgdA/CDA1 family)
MDPDSGALQAASQIFKSTCIIVSFTACQNYKTETATALTPISPFFKDSIVQTIKKTPSEKKKKTIYLTFDDGPNKGTQKVMHIIDQEQVMVSAFVVGEHVYDSWEQTKVFDSLMANRFYEIANHSFTHAHNKYEKFYSMPQSVVKDFIRCADSLHLTTKIVRTPGRNIWRMKNIASTDVWKSKPAADSVQAKGFIEVGWDLEWRFDNELKLKNTSDEMVQQVDNMFTYAKTRIPNHLIILAHDQVYADATDSVELQQFIQKLKATNKYEFEKISNYPGIKN